MRPPLRDTWSLTDLFGLSHILYLINLACGLLCFLCSAIGKEKFLPILYNTKYGRDEPWYNKQQDKATMNVNGKREDPLRHNIHTQQEAKHPQS